MASKRRNTFYESKKQETTEIGCVKDHTRVSDWKDLILSTLDFLAEPHRSIPSMRSIPVCGFHVNVQAKDVYMAHALRRISYASCDPAHSQFSFLAREPKGHFTLQYCHTFLAKTPEQELGGNLRWWTREEKSVDPEPERRFASSCKDADIIGYPMIELLGEAGDTRIIT
ncbi:hypothetical protein AAG570_005965 [Ranatra chinensis]|uniref:Uncharacterized protein n=1 Tax=Ranatra chinensis TaxID=642074 RepID=A0ABD0XZ94_9HEMI